MTKSEDIAQSLARARLLEDSDPSAAGDLYAAVLKQDPACLEAHNALERLGHPERFGHWMHVNCSIHPDDDIFRFFADSPASLNPVRDYLADGWRTLSELMVLLERLDRPLLKIDSVLEFACGFGRFTRHLARTLPGKITAADVLPGSADFVGRQFGVESFQSSFRPAEVEFPRRFELVFVLSLFTHLPVAAWAAWLKALMSAVQPGGLLVISVHNEQAAADFGVKLGKDGTFYAQSSESPSLDPSHYGTTFTTREVVEQQVRAALGRAPDHIEPLAFWVGQDAVVISAPGE